MWPWSRRGSDVSAVPHLMAALMRKARPAAAFEDSVRIKNKEAYYLH